MRFSTIVSFLPLLALASATGFPHIIEEYEVVRRQEPEPTTTSTTTEVVFVTVTRTLPTDGNPTTEIVTPTMTPIDTPVTSIAPNSTLAEPTGGSNQTSTQLPSPSETADDPTDGEEDDDSAAGKFAMSKVVGLMGVVAAVFAGML